MNFEEKIQQQFDSAGGSLDLDPGSLDAVKHDATRRTSRNRKAMSVTSIVLVVGLGALVWVINGGGNQRDALIETVDQPRPPDSTPMTEADLTYVGAFMLPAEEFAGSSFAYGGAAAAFHPSGDPESTDGYNGSLFMSGHPRLNPGIAEITIPVPVSHDGTTTNLPVAGVLQDFADVTSGRGTTYVGSPDVGGSDEYFYGGLEVVDGPSGSRLHWTIWQFNNVSDNDVPGHGHSSLNLDSPDPQGPWFLSGYTNQSTPGYVFTVPQDRADEFFDGRNLIAGYNSLPTIGRSFGPPFFAFEAPTVAEPRTRLDAQVLALYEDENEALEGFSRADLTGGAAWITTSDGADAIVTVGRRALGEVHDGAPREDDCGTDTGVHGGPYEPQIQFYDPADLAQVAAGEMEPFLVRPYRSWNPSDFLVPTCEWELSSISFDATTGRIYVVQVGADLTQSQFSPVPVVHVFTV